MVKLLECGEFAVMSDGEDYFVRDVAEGWDVAKFNNWQDAEKSAYELAGQVIL